MTWSGVQRPESFLGRFTPAPETRNPLLWGRVHAGAGLALIGVGAITLVVGGFDPKTYGWATLFGVLGTVQIRVALGLLWLAHSTPPDDRP